ncbi:MAG: SDR family oxidoreductase [Actinomycetota bacterium]
MSTSVALVTGANRGIGLEVARQLAELDHTVFLGARSPRTGAAAAAPLQAAGLDVRPVELDVTERATIDGAAAEIERQVGRLDVVVNNAAIHYDTANRATDPDLQVVREALDTNLHGAWDVLLATLPLLRASDAGRVVNVSSGAGALTDMGGGLPAYRLSKVGLNALTRMWAAELDADGILVNSVCPGWVATDMGGGGGRPVEDGADGIVWAATLPDGGPTGGFFRDRRPIPW